MSVTAAGSRAWKVASNCFALQAWRSAGAWGRTRRLNVRASLLATLLLSLPSAQARERPQAPSDTAAPAASQDCEETEACIVQDLGLSDDQQEQVRTILQDAARKQDDLRDDTIRQIEQVLTPEQARQLEARRVDILAYRASRLRHKATQMQQRARQMKEPQ